MVAVREQIFNEIEQRLGEVEGIGEVERQPSGDPASFPALAIFDSGQQLTESDAINNWYQLEVTIDGTVEGGSGPEAHAALNALYVSIVQALVTEPPLGGLAETIDEGALRVDVAELASERRLNFSLDLSITFPTRRGDPAQPA